MATTNATRLKQKASAGARYQRTRRAGMRARGRPETTTVDYALVEAAAFLIAAAAVSTLRADGDAADAKALARSMVLSVEELKATTLDILVRREGYSLPECKIALGQRLGYRKIHREPWHVPSLRPDPAAQAERVHQAAEERVKRGRAAA